MKHHLFIGIDRSDSHLDLCVLDGGGDVLKQHRISSDPEALAPWVEEIRGQLPEGTTAALCIEQPCQNLVHFFGRFEHLRLFLINPAMLKKYRESLSDSRAKDDRRDARALALLVLERHARMEAWAPADDTARRLATLVEKRRQLVDLRVSLTNKLTQTLKECFPQALKLVGRELHKPLACTFLEKWPTLQALRRSRPETIKRFYIAHGSRRPKPIEERLELIQRAVPMCDDPESLETYSLLIASFVAQIRQLQKSIGRFDAEIATVTASHSDARLFTSLPGAGAALSSRLLAFFGSDRSRYKDAGALQKHSGVAPLTKQSGKMHFVHRRYACNKFWRQTFVEWAAQTVMKSLWAKAYYLQQKRKGQRHHTILRGLAYKWQRILFRCWQNRELYDEARYIKALEKTSSPLIPIINEVRTQYPNLCEHF
jgi:transposase